MTPLLSLLFGAAFISWLFYRDKQWRRLPSKALWIPGIWLTLVGSRPVSFWLSVSTGRSIQSSNLEGSPINVVFNGALFLAALLVLGRQGFSWATFSSGNKALVSLYAFYACSVLWSPFPVPTLKRIFQDFGCVLTGLVFLTEEDPAASIRVVFTRVSYLLFPLSVVFTRWFPDIGRTVSLVSGTHMLSGVTEHKNSLGQMTMVFCLVLLWDLIDTRKYETFTQRQPERFARLVNLGIGLYLLVISSSATALITFLLGVALFLAGSRLARRKKAGKTFMVVILSIVCVLFLQRFFRISSLISESMGRGTELTGRTQIWQKIMEKNKKYLVGNGFRGFWETDEGESVSRELGTNQLITAHNGYLETYLNGGLVALFLMGALIWSTGLSATRKLVDGDPIGRLAVVFWLIILIYNVTESTFFQVSPLWFIMLLLTIDCRWRNLSAREVL